MTPRRSTPAPSPATLSPREVWALPLCAYAHQLCRDRSRCEWSWPRIQSVIADAEQRLLQIRAGGDPCPYHWVYDYVNQQVQGCPHAYPVHPKLKPEDT